MSVAKNPRSSAGKQSDSVRRASPVANAAVPPTPEEAQLWAALINVLSKDAAIKAAQAKPPSPQLLGKAAELRASLSRELRVPRSDNLRKEWDVVKPITEMDRVAADIDYQRRKAERKLARQEATLRDKLRKEGDILKPITELDRVAADIDYQRRKAERKLARANGARRVGGTKAAVALGNPRGSPTQRRR